MAKRQTKIGEDDFESLDKLAHNVVPEKMRPLSPAMRRRWEAAKRAGRGRPPKTPGTKAVPTLITVDPKLLKLIDTQAAKRGVSRSQFLSDAARQQLGLAG